MSQDVRLSQFVLTWGPGAILESQKGPRMIPTPDIGLFNRPEIQVSYFESSDIMRARNLLDGLSVFILPSSEENRDCGGLIYRTKAFPDWCICEQHEILYKRWDGCPSCRKSSLDNREATRFVVACPNGHLDDVNWNGFVHSGGHCNTDYYKWEPNPNVNQIRITCPVCKSSTTMGRVYQLYNSGRLKCTGRSPEREDVATHEIPRPGCMEAARVILRQSSSLRIPELLTLFTIPKACTNLHNLLQITPIYSVLDYLFPENQKIFNDMLSKQETRGQVTKASADELRKYSWPEIRQAWSEVNEQESPMDQQELLAAEFSALKRASYAGVPPERGACINSPYRFKLNLADVRTFEMGRSKFRVSPIEKLHTLIIQTGYRRLVSGSEKESELVKISFDREGRKWVPGVDFFGEGLFICLENGSELTYGSSRDQWTEMYTTPSAYSTRQGLFKDKTSYELNPVFVWWHTLSHHIMRLLSVNSGYSAASIRERIYVKQTPAGMEGGVVLYTVQPGADGTLGGLISLASSFDKLLKTAFLKNRSCSNDPICMERAFSPGDHSGSACYGCLLVSETSCEYRNMWLDRKILADVGP